MNTKQKQAKVRQLSTNAIRSILDIAPDERPNSRAPLAGQVAIQGIGGVPVAWLRAELARREEA
jgi:hypothetical protein